MSPTHCLLGNIQLSGTGLVQVVRSNRLLGRFPSGSSYSDVVDELGLGIRSVIGVLPTACSGTSTAIAACTPVPDGGKLMEGVCEVAL